MNVRMTIALVAGVLLGCASSPQQNTAARDAGPGVMPMIVEEAHKHTFFPPSDIPSGTVLSVMVRRKSPKDAIRIHRCNTARCDEAITMKVWRPRDYRVGDELSWEADRSGSYYVWVEDIDSGTPIPIASNEIFERRLRMSVASGSQYDAWYVLQ